LGVLALATKQISQGNNDRVRPDPMMQRWREEDKQLVIETLTRKAGGM
jgi:hypothetical protein